MMRTTGEIISAVKENGEASEEELRLCIVALSSCCFFFQHVCRDLLKDRDNIARKLRISSDFGTDDSSAVQGIPNWYHRCLNTDVEKWLGPNYIPWTEEYKRSYDVSLKILNKVMEGKDSEY